MPSKCAARRKFGRTGICRLCGWDKVDLLITAETPENAGEIRFLKQAGVKIELVPLNNNN